MSYRRTENSKPVGQSATVNRKFFQVALAPGAGVLLDMGMKRFANQPNYAFPWHGDSVPVR